jgi:hypothetical protein
MSKGLHLWLFVWPMTIPQNCTGKLFGIQAKAKRLSYKTKTPKTQRSRSKDHEDELPTNLSLTANNGDSYLVFAKLGL